MKTEDDRTTAMAEGNLRKRLTYKTFQGPHNKISVSGAPEWKARTEQRPWTKKYA